MNRLKDERGNVAVVVILAIVGVLAFALLIFGIRWITAEPSGELQQREQTIGDGTYRISAYEQFYDDCASAVTLQQNLENAIKQRDEYTGGDVNRQAQLDANVTALQNLLNNAVNEYNANARKVDTRAHFKASDLPYQLDLEGTISCTV